MTESPTAVELAHEVWIDLPADTDVAFRLADGPGGEADEVAHFVVNGHRLAVFDEWEDGRDEFGSRIRWGWGLTFWVIEDDVEEITSLDAVRDADELRAKISKWVAAQ